MHAHVQSIMMCGAPSCSTAMAAVSTGRLPLHGITDQSVSLRPSHVPCPALPCPLVVHHQPAAPCRTATSGASLTAWCWTACASPSSTAARRCLAAPRCWAPRLTSRPLLPALLPPPLGRPQRRLGPLRQLAAATRLSAALAVQRLARAPTTTCKRLELLLRGATVKCCRPVLGASFDDVESRMLFQPLFERF